MVLSPVGIARAQESALGGPIELSPTPSAPRASPDWTWVTLGVGITLFAGGLGTGIGALVVQADLDGVCTLTCPTRFGDYQAQGRILAVTTDVLLLSGGVVAVFGLVAALALADEVPTPALACDEHGCFGSLTGRF